MRFLADMPLSPELAQWLCAKGHDAVHGNELSMNSSPDAEILQDREAHGSRRHHGRPGLPETTRPLRFDGTGADPRPPSGPLPAPGRRHPALVR
ncbi:MAG: DUF5615 family PIN-like protein [Bryobacteraceae bacterium]